MPALPTLLQVLTHIREQLHSVEAQFHESRGDSSTPLRVESGARKFGKFGESRGDSSTPLRVESGARKFGKFGESRGDSSTPLRVESGARKFGKFGESRPSKREVHALIKREREAVRTRAAQHTRESRLAPQSELRVDCEKLCEAVAFKEEAMDRLQKRQLELCKKHGLTRLGQARRGAQRRGGGERH